jgi:hypothetical protein
MRQPRLRPAGPIAALLAGAFVLGSAHLDRLAEVRINLLSVSAQPTPRTGGVPAVLRRSVRTRWRVTYLVSGKTKRPLASFARITLERGATRWRFRSAQVSQIGATTWQYVAPVPSWFPSGTATLVVEVHLTVKGHVEETTTRQYRVRVR